MHNIKLTIQYDGTRYAGWQFQKNALSIQEVIERALKKITGENVTLTGSGRTDSGVHARAQIANFKTSSKIPLKNLLMALNSVLPKDIVVTHIDQVRPDFNSQHDAKRKSYRYTIVNNDYLSPFVRRFAAKCFYNLDIGAMRHAARYLVGRHDFTSFQTKDLRESSAVRTIKKIRIEKTGEMIYIDIEANGFLYNMARNIVGTLVEAGRGKISAEKVECILKNKDRALSGPTMPAKGLCLMKVYYPAAHLSGERKSKAF
jgi:tRNA pseudouridine38-40 synthase